MADTGASNSAHLSDTVHETHAADTVADDTSRTMYSSITDDGIGAGMTSAGRTEANLAHASTDRPQPALPGLVMKFQASDTRSSGDASRKEVHHNGSAESCQSGDRNADHAAVGTSRTSYPFTPQVTSSQDAISRVPQIWPLKKISWPPFSQNSRSVKILIQDVNGPCSFLALCNVLLMRGDIRLRSDANTINYNELCQLLADYLLDRMSTASPVTPSLSGNALDYALNIIPTTLSGLDVNIDFIKGTISAAEGSQQGALELFKIANVPIKHGWLAPQEDTETFDVLSSVAPDYDTAVTRLVEGDDLTAGAITASQGGPASPALESVFESLTIDPERQAKVFQATIIQRYLSSTSTQLTYSGLFTLAENTPQGSLCALFRNSHFSVLYRRPDALPEHLTEQERFKLPTLPPATLFHLVTDQALVNEPTAVWESLEDVDGAASRFYDSNLGPASIKQDWASRRQRTSQDVRREASSHDADLALAAQMQQEEYDFEAREAARAATRATARAGAPAAELNSSTQVTQADPTRTGLIGKDHNMRTAKHTSSMRKKGDKKDCVIS